MSKLKTLPAMISISAKCSDCFGATFCDADNNEVAEYDGYVPSFFPEKHYGDYVQLDIELATGKILNWKVPTLDDINDTLKDSSGHSVE
jgi:hypothetical protein